MMLRRLGLTALPALPSQAPGQVLLILHTVQGGGAGRRDRVRHGLREYRARGPRSRASRRGCGAVRGQARALRCGTPRRPLGRDVPGTGCGAQSGTLLTPRDPPREPDAWPPSPTTPPPPSPASAPCWRGPRKAPGRGPDPCGDSKGRSTRGAGSLLAGVRRAWRAAAPVPCGWGRTGHTERTEPAAPTCPTAERCSLRPELPSGRETH